MTIDQLKGLGYRVRVTHLRLTRSGVLAPRFVLRALGEAPLPTGGMTIVKVDDAVGVAACRSDENFSRKLGREIALGRALRSIAPGEHA